MSERWLLLLQDLKSMGKGLLLRRTLAPAASAPPHAVREAALSAPLLLPGGASQSAAAPAAAAEAAAKPAAVTARRTANVEAEVHLPLTSALASASPRIGAARPVAAAVPDVLDSGSTGRPRSLRCTI